MPGFLVSRSKIRSVFLRALETICSVSLYPKQKTRSVFLRTLETTCLDFLYPDQKSGLFSCEHWKRYAQSLCIQNKNQVCFLASTAKNVWIFARKNKNHVHFFKPKPKIHHIFPMTVLRGRVPLQPLHAFLDSKTTNIPTADGLPS